MTADPADALCILEGVCVRARDSIYDLAEYETNAR